MTKDEIKAVLLLHVICPEDGKSKYDKECCDKMLDLFRQGAPLSMIFEAIPIKEDREKFIALAEELEK